MQITVRPPKTVAVTIREGGEWILFDAFKKYGHQYSGYMIHSIKFSDGSIWDAWNGWRFEDVDR